MLIFRWELFFKRAVGVSINTFLRNQPLDTRKGRRLYLDTKRRSLEVRLVLLYQLIVVYFVCLPLILHRLSTPKAKPSTTRTRGRTSFFRCCDHLLLLHFAFQLLVFFLLSSMKRFASIWCTSIRL